MRRFWDRLVEWFFSDTWLGALLWFVVVLGLLALLVWFTVFSGFGAPAAPVYENF
ncbi:hypothetical protein [Adlercreutzia equolifaciens]|uniref:hypothetical protein n=1 Tax=Adlercreutzia equolifaciens TaxID=446660 RepID=UPI000389799C|nr:hypothetical protein [Adlercreutzia equolifaciens]BAN76651.1 hypothetical protein AEQU_0682 [Adlercreutzia equolifaciens DSM 19450]HJI12202.1 hypothetical protein [Adlercreutzia equolifaciens]